MNSSKPTALFTRNQLTSLIVPLIIEQFLGIFVGMADTMMVAAAGEAAVSGVSLVDTLNVLLSVLFTALTAGGSVVISQALGAKDEKHAHQASEQLLLTATSMSLVITVIALLGNKSILAAIFGKTSAEVMESARIYFFFMAFSYPFLAIYNACASMFRSMGNSKVSMAASLVMNLMNICGNAILVYTFHMGAAGVAISSVVSRIMAATVLLLLLRRPGQPLTLRRYTLHFHLPTIKKLLYIGVPSGIETSIFQVGKILVLSLVASFGTSATTANAVANNLNQFSLIPAAAIGTSLVTIVGQCVGANAYDQAVTYTKKLMFISHLILAVTCSLLTIFCPWLLKLYQLSPETMTIAIKLVRLHSICAIFLYPEAFGLSNTLRAASDVRYPMMVAILSMWIWRVGFSYILGLNLGLGVLGVWIAMMTDWVCRSICFVTRFLRGIWKTKARKLSA